MFIHILEYVNCHVHVIYFHIVRNSYHIYIVFLQMQLPHFNIILIFPIILQLQLPPHEPVVVKKAVNHFLQVLDFAFFFMLV